MGKKIPATSKDVRLFFDNHKKMIPAGAEKSVQVSCKGRIKPEAIAVFNKHSGMQYTEGNRRHIDVPYVKMSADGKRLRRIVSLPEPEVRMLCAKVAGKRGPLSQAALAYAGEQYAKTL